VVRLAVSYMSRNHMSNASGHVFLPNRKGRKQAAKCAKIIPKIIKRLQRA
jgi:hypothetical protein